jgi:hypothetical protein
VPCPTGPSCAAARQDGYGQASQARGNRTGAEMLRARDTEGSGILWFERGISVAHIAHMMTTAPKIPKLPPDLVLGMGASPNDSHWTGNQMDSGIYIACLRNAQIECVSDLRVRLRDVWSSRPIRFYPKVKCVRS